MILRRIADALRRQDWITVLIEFVLVIAGVLIALQVNNWNETRAAQARLDRYVDELQLDLAAEREEMMRVQQIAIERHAALSYILGEAIDWAMPDVIERFGEDLQIDPIPEFEVELGQAIFNEVLTLETFDGQRHTFDALTNTGEFQLFNRRPIARDLRAHYADISSFQDFESNYLLPRYLGLYEQLHEHGIARFDEVDPDALIGVVLEDPVLASRLREFAILTDVQYRRLIPLIEETEALEARLAVLQ
ncbi:hypothetical protein [Hyphobacterium sp.]|uniref:hypothetical protein n=1 Tax=Hyphobacterium sp. TaxID=2004662 RepID=UPI003BAB20B1